MAGLFEMRIVCKEEECKRYKLLTEECLKIHKKIFHGNQQFKDRTIEHCYSKINEGLKCNTLIESNIQGEPKYRDKKGKKYTDRESFLNRTKLRENKIKENQRKRKGDTVSHGGGKNDQGENNKQKERKGRKL